MKWCIQTHSKVAGVLHLIRVSARFWMFLRSPLVEEIKRQMLLPCELLSQCSSVITMCKVSTREQLLDLMSKRELGGKHKGRTMLLHLSGFTSSFYPHW